MESDGAANFGYTDENIVQDDKFEEHKKEENQEIRIETNDQLNGWSNICRVCAKSNDHIIPIFEAEGVQHDLSDKIHKYLPIRVSRTDTLPIQLCYHCAATILAWHELVGGCLDAQRQLLEMHSDRVYKEKSRSKNCENASEQLPDHHEPVSGEKQNSGTTAQQDGEDQTCDFEEDSKARSDRAEATFRVFLDKQNVYQGSKWTKNDISQSALNEREKIKGQEVSGAKGENLMRCIDSMEPANGDQDFQDEDNKVLKDPCYESRSMHNMERHEKSLYPLNLQEENGDASTVIGPRVQENSSIPRKSYECEECSKIFRLKDSLIRHQRIHRDERPFTCHICGKQFRDSGGLSRHLKDVHAKLKKFTCDICAKSFSSKATRDDHRRTHTGERPYNCENCNKSFKSRACLYIHSKLHTDEFPYPCVHCNKKFRRRQEMLLHLSTHTGERNYSCDVCSRRFRVKTEVARHKLTHSNEKPYVCAECGLSFRQKRYLNNHIKSRHPQTVIA